METNYPSVICQGKQQRGRGGPGQAGDKQPSQATLFMGFFMYFCIYLDIPELESWGFATCPSTCMVLAVTNGRLPACGAPSKEPALAWAGAAPGELGWCLCPWTCPFGHAQGSCFRNGSRMLDVRVMGRSGPCLLTEVGT